jgi:hypothetical protein
MFEGGRKEMADEVALQGELAAAHLAGEEALEAFNRAQFIRAAIQQHSNEHSTPEEIEQLHRLAAALWDATRAADAAANATSEMGEDEKSPVQAAWEETAKAIQRSFAEVFSDIQRDGLDSLKGFASQVIRLFQDLAAQIAAAMAMEKLGINKLLQDLDEKGFDGLTARQQKMLELGGAGLAGIGIGTAAGRATGSASGGAIGGALGGAAAGAAMGGALGALAGGVTGLVSGLLSGAAAAREARAAFAEAMHDINRSIHEFRENAAGIGELGQQNRAIFQSVNDIVDAMRAAVKERFDLNIGDVDIQSVDDIDAFVSGLEELLAILGRTGLFDDAKKGLREFLGTMDELRAGLEENLAALRASFVDDLELRSLRARGMEAEADALELQRRHEQELRDAERLKLDATTMALLERVHEEERLALATKKTSDAIKSATSALNAPDGLRLSLWAWRATQLTGDEPPPGTRPIHGPDDPRPADPIGVDDMRAGAAAADIDQAREYATAMSDGAHALEESAIAAGRVLEESAARVLELWSVADATSAAEMRRLVDVLRTLEVGDSSERPHTTDVPTDDTVAVELRRVVETLRALEDDDRAAGHRGITVERTDLPVSTAVTNTSTQTLQRIVHVNVAAGAINVTQKTNEDPVSLADRILEALEAKEHLGGGDPLDGRAF